MLSTIFGTFSVQRNHEDRFSTDDRSVTPVERNVRDCEDRSVTPTVLEGRPRDHEDRSESPKVLERPASMDEGRLTLMLKNCFKDQGFEPLKAEDVPQITDIFVSVIEERYFWAQIIDKVSPKVLLIEL